MENVDLVVIGAGWHGLAAAKTYSEVNPLAKLVVLDSAATIGGVWAKDRLYPGLKTNNLYGTYEYSDFPMDEATFGVKSGEHIPGQVVHEYLRKYAEKFKINDQIRFNTKVETVERTDSGAWIITSVPSGSNSNKDVVQSPVLHTQKLVVATGLTSQPFIPDFMGSASFEAPIFHCRYLQDNKDTVYKTANSVVVFGGTKSAWDTAYAYAAANVTVHWVIRKSGHGPIWMTPPYVTPFKRWLEKLVSTRLLMWFSPCIWGDYDDFGGIRRLLHGTIFGRWLVAVFWRILAHDVLSRNGYDKHPETQKLKPWINVFWVATSLSILNYPTDFFEFVRNGQIKVHVSDISHLSSKTVHLSSGEALETDALICSTGWKYRPAIKFLPEGMDALIGLPHHSEMPEDELVKKADQEILNRFPSLKSQPYGNPDFKPLTSDESTTSLNQPYRLYRFMAPPAIIQERTIAFSGVVQSIHTPLLAQTQALWLTAYLDGKLSVDLRTPEQRLDSKISLEDRVKWEAILQSRFGRWRYPGGHGQRYADFVFDGIPYIDMLLKDLGLKSHRKNGLLAECFEPYDAADYRGLVDEWKAKGLK